jgi:C1A family cysteine protease
MAAQEPIDRKTAVHEQYFAYDAGAVSRALAYEGEGAAAPQWPSGFASDAEGGAPPDLVDHRARQSPVKYQGSRTTCVAHASLAWLEAFPQIGGDLSEQYAHYKFNVFTGQSHGADTVIRTTDAAVFLSRPDGRVCREADWAYVRAQATIAALVKKKQYGPPKPALANQTYGVSTYKIVTDQGLTADSIRNTRYLEAVVAQGYDIVFGAWASWDEDNSAGILTPYLENGEPVKEAGHAMLLVGYNRAAEYFIVKNSFDVTWGHGGYGFFSYDFARLYFKYGFVVDSAEPPAPAVS